MLNEIKPLAEEGASLIWLHPGEKRLLIYAEELANLPSNAVLDVQHLCAFAGKLDTPIVAHLERMLERLDQKLIEFGR